MATMKQLLAISLVLLSVHAHAQQLDAQKRREVVEAVAARYDSTYVFPAKATEMAKRLRDNLRRGAYDSITEAPALAQALTRDLRAVSNDLHLQVVYSPDAPPPLAEQERMARKENFGFATAQRLDGNIGYIDVRVFFPAEVAARTADAAMAFVAHTDALIFDVRRHIGGEPDMVAYLTSYLVAPQLLNEQYSRVKGGTRQYHTHAVPGPRYEKPVYVLTSRATFSGGEEFAYNLKHLGRAKLIGETTGGGAHPTTPFKTAHGFLAFVPHERAINPVTKTNWEGTGVQPDVAVPADDALRTALEAIANDRGNPAARVALDAWVKSFNEDDAAARERFLRERSTLPPAQIQQYVGLDAGIRAEYGPYEIVRITGASGHSIVALLRHTSGNGHARVTIEVDASGKITKIGLEPAEPE